MYYLYHIRKTGGRSIIHSFLALASETPADFYEELARHPNNRIKRDKKLYVGWNTTNLKNFFFAFSHAPHHAVKPPLDAFTITCLRNPLSRLISYFNYLQDIRTAVEANPRHVHARMPDLAWAHKNPIKFLKQVPKKHALNQLFMFSRNMQPKEAVKNILGVDAVLSTENLDIEIGELASKINLPLTPQHFGVTKTKRDLPEEFITRARQMLQPEFEMGERLRERGTI